MNVTDTSQVVASQQLPNPMEGLALTPQNQKILQDLAEDLFEKIVGEKAPEGAMQQLFSYICPSARQMGGAAGYAVGQTYGSEICSRIIHFVCSSFYTSPAPQPNGWNLWKKAADTGVNVVEVGLQLAVTPMALPWITLFASGAGASAAALSVALVSKLYKQLSDNHYTPENLPAPEDLIHFNEDLGIFCDASGRPFTETDLKDLFSLAKQYELVIRLMECDAAQVEVVINQYVQEIAQKREIEGKKLEKIQKVANEAIGRLQGHNFKGKKGILPAIEKLANKAAKIDNKALFFKTQQLHNISKSFDRMKELLDVPAATVDLDYGFDEANGKLYVPSSRLSSWYYGVSAERTSNGINDCIKKALMGQCEAIQNAVQKLQNPSEEELEAIDAKIAEFDVACAQFYDQIGHSRAGEEVKPTAEKMIQEVKEKLLDAHKHLADQI